MFGSPFPFVFGSPFRKFQWFESSVIGSYGQATAILISTGKPMFFFPLNPKTRHAGATLLSFGEGKKPSSSKSEKQLSRNLMKMRNLKLLGSFHVLFHLSACRSSSIWPATCVDPSTKSPRARPSQLPFPALTEACEQCMALAVVVAVAIVVAIVFFMFWCWILIVVWLLLYLWVWYLPLLRIPIAVPFFYSRFLVLFVIAMLLCLLLLLYMHF